MAISYMGNRLQELRNEKAAQAAEDAHERRMASRNRFIESNPGAVSPQERAAVGQWNFNQGLTGRERELKDHELNFLKQQGENAVDLQRQKGEDDLAVTKQKGADELAIAEREWAGRKDIAMTQAEAANYGADRTLEGVKDTNKTSLLTEQERQDGAFKVAQQSGANDLAVTKQKGADAREVAQTQLKAEEEKARIEAAQRAEHGQNNLQAQQEKLVQGYIKLLDANPATRNLTPEEKRKRALQYLGASGNGGSGLDQFRS